MSVTIAGARVLLTGATGGIGAALATEFAGRGARLILTGHKPEALRRLADSLPGEHKTHLAELSDPLEAARLAGAAGEVDILVANAGVVAASRLEILTAGQIATQVSLNLTSAAVLAAELGSGMLSRHRGHVVLMSSIAGRLVTVANGPVYTATKWGLRGLGLALREDWRGSGVSASVVYPGPVAEAGMFARAGTPPPRGVRAATPREVARATLRAIERDRAEVIVADPATRALCGIGGLVPGIAAVPVRRSAASRSAREIQARHDRETAS